MFWPPGVPSSGPGLKWRFAAGGPPLGDGLPGPHHFSVLPQRAGGEFSLGDPGAEGLPRRSEELLALKAQLEAGAPPLAARIGDLAVFCRDFALADPKGGSPGQFSGWINVAASCLDELERAIDLDVESRQTALGALRTALAGLDLQVLPETWSYAEPSAAEKTAQPVFDPKLPRGQLVCQFGLLARGAKVRETRLILSAGPKPAGYDDLAAAAALLPDNLREAVQEGMARWPAAARRGDLPNAIVFLFMDWYDKLAPSLPGGPCLFAVRTAFEKLLSGLELRMIEPERGKRVENPGEFLDVVERRRVSEAGARSGCVLEVLRPAILDARRNKTLCRARVILSEASS